jgi:hypothetical protein
LLRMGLAASTWLLTIAVSVPLHRALEPANDPALVQRLVRTHALRTAAWSGGAIVAVLIAFG